MSSTQIADKKAKILELLHDKSVATVVIQGEAGIGKTWMAREISERAIEEGLSCGSIWVCCTKKQDIGCIFEDIVHQFSPTHPGDKLDEVNEGNDKTTGSSNVTKDKALKIIKEKTSSTDRGGKFLLIILDDVPLEMKEAEITTELLAPHGQKVKLLITRNCEHRQIVILEPAMSSTKVEEAKAKILELLDDERVAIVVIQGEAGVGKTWMAREINKFVMEKSLSCCNIWVSCTNKQDVTCIYADIVHQLSPIPPTEEGDDSNEGADKNTNSSAILKDKVLKLIAKKMLSEDQGEKFLLIILDDVPTKMKEADITAALLVPHGQKVKILITKRDYSGNDTIEEAARTVEIEPFPSKDLSTLLEKLVDKEISEFPNFETLSTAIAEKSRGLPAAIVMIAATLNSIARNKSSCWNLESVLREVASSEGLPEDLTKMLQYCHDMLPSMEMANCFWYIRQFFPRHGGIHYNELIANWILEGYFGDIDHVENAYAKGHRVLMELLDRRLLKILHNNIVSIEGLALKIPDHRYGGYGGTSSLGLACAFDDGRWEGLGRITWTDGMIQTLCRSKDQKITTLLLDGSRLSREVPETFFEPMKDLKILALFKPRFKSLPLPLLKMEKLLVLALRGSDRLENINEIDRLKALIILEISGATSLKMIPDDIFEHVVHIRTLNLTSVPINNLPSSFSKLSGLRWLILRDCPCLETLPHLTTLGNLEMLDASRTNLTEFLDKCFAPLRKLQYLNLSQTRIVRLPFICNAARLTWLLLRGCSRLFRLPSLPRSLQILDLSDSASTEIEPGLRATEKQSSPDVTNLRHLNLSGCGALEKLPPTKAFEKLELLDVSNAVNLKEIEDESFNHLKHLKVLNLSNTKVDTLPSLHKLGNLRELLLKDCKSLKRLPIMEGLLRLKELNLSGASSLEEMGPMSPDCEKFDLPNLQKLLLAGCDHLKKLPPLNTLEKLDNLDLSGCTLLNKIPDESFEHVPRLHVLNLSETKIERLPSVAKLDNLHRLILRDCHLLTTLTGLESLTKLQELDLCGTSFLGEVKAKCLECMHQLQILKLSGTKVDELPSISNLTNLTQLSLSGCSGFTELPHLDALTKLKDLDLAGTEIKSPASIKTLGNLQRLSLRNCTSLESEELPPFEPHSGLEELDLVGIRINEFPYWIFELTNLKCLHLPDLKVIQQVDWSKIKCLPERVNWEECGIFKLEGTLTDSNRPFLSVRGTDFFQFLGQNSTLRNTCFKQFHFSVYPPREPGKGGDIYRYRNDLDSRKIYNKIRHLPDPGQLDRVPDPAQPDWVSHPGQPDQLPDLRQLDRSLEFYGFKSLCEYPREVIKCGNCISFIDDSCMSCLSDLGCDNLEALKGCWLETCNRIECIFAGSDVTTLWVSNLPHLRSIYSETVQSKGHKNLKNLYIDCCPMLMGAFSSHQLPENLEVIQIKFCNKLETLIEPETSTEHTLPKLKTLHLLGLPMLKKIGLQLLENLEIVQIQNCDKVETLFDHETLRLCTLPKLHTLHLLELPFLKSIGVSSASPGTCGVLECPNLKNLHIEFCPMIVRVSSSSQPPKDLEVIQIQHCDKLESLFEDKTPAEYELSKLHTLRLLELPRLKSIGVSGAGSSLKTYIRGCPSLPDSK